MNLNKTIEELQQIEAEWNGHAAAEKLGGNVVKEAHYKGTATGVRIAVDILNELKMEQPSDPAAGTRSVATIKTIADAIAEYKGTRGSSAVLLLHKVLDKLIGLKCPHCHQDISIKIE